MLLRESAGECGAERSGAAGAVGHSPTKPLCEGRRLRAAGNCGRKRPAEKTDGKPAVRSSCEGTGGVVS